MERIRPALKHFADDGPLPSARSAFKFHPELGDRETPSNDATSLLAAAEWVPARSRILLAANGWL